VLLIVGIVSVAYAADTPPAKTTAPAQPKTPEKKPAPDAEADDELLEFLGSVDSETGDQDWLDYLSRTDVAKVAKGKKDD
jgi:hypothetical protein